MLNRISIKQRMFLIIALIMILFIGMAWFAARNSNKVRDMALESTGQVMLEDQKAKLKVATHSIAVALGHAVESIADKETRIKILRKEISDIRFEEDKSGYFFIYNGTVIVAHPIKEALQGKDLKGVKDKNNVFFAKEMAKNAKAGGGFVEYIWEKPGAGDTPKIAYSEMIPGTDYWIGAGVYLDNIDAYKSEMEKSINSQVKSMIIQMIMVAGILFIGIVALCLIIVFGITKSLNSMISSFKDIAEGEGDLTKRIEINSKDELGELAGWFNIFLEKLQKIIKQLAEESANVDRSSNELTGISDEMSKGAESMSKKADTVATATEELSSSMSSVAASMEQSTSNSNMVASAAEEMNSTINEIAGNAEKARDISDNASEKTNEAASEMTELNKAANSVGRVVETITDISEQVNLLALNATIEAARAGEAGKGFAVVANEIKALANQTSEATYDIKSQIENIQSVSSKTAESISGVTTAINSTQEIVSSIASAIEEQSSATSEISSNVEQLSSGIKEVNENVAQSSDVTKDISQDITAVSSAASEITGSSQKVKDNSAHLKEMATKLNSIVETFIIE